VDFAHRNSKYLDKTTFRKLDLFPSSDEGQESYSVGSVGICRIVSSGLLRRMALVRTDVSEKPSASFIRITRIGELGTTQAATSNRRTLHPDEGGARFLRNVGSYKSHTA
jgi:hypothetical protein